MATTIRLPERVMLMMNNSSLRYIAYCRKSSDENTKQIQSLETQQRLNLEQADRDGLNVIDVLKEARSAKDDNNRPQFSSMLKRIESGEVNAILAVHLDRLSRNWIEAGKIAKLIEQGKLKEIRTPNRIYSSVQDLLYMGFDFLFASNYSRELSVKVKHGNETKLLKGGYPGMAYIGYLNDKETKEIVPDPLRFTYIQKLFRLFSTGEYSLKQVASILYKDGLRTRLGNKKVHKSVLHKCLRNPFYYGAILRNDILYKGKHKPAVSKTLWDRVQTVLNGTNRSKKQTHNFLYRGYLSCAVCGCKLTASLKKGRYVYYYCTNGKGVCSQHRDYLDEPGVQDLLQSLMKQSSLPGDLASLSLKLYMEDRMVREQDKLNGAKLMQQELSGIQKKLNRLLDLLLENSLDEQTYQEKRKALMEEKTNLEIALSKYTPPNPTKTLELLEKIKKRCISLHSEFKKGNKQVKKELLDFLLWNCEIADGKIQKVQYKKPYDYLKDLPKNTDILEWRRRRDSNSRMHEAYTLSRRAP